MSSKQIRSILFYLIPVLLVAMLLSNMNRTVDDSKKLSISELIVNIEDAKVKEIKSIGPVVQGTLKDGTTFQVYLTDEIRQDFYNTYLKDPVERQEILYRGEPVPQPPWYMELLPTILTFVLLIGFWYFMMNQAQGGNTRMMNFGKSRAKLNKDEGNKVTFADVAGLVEEKEELGEIVDFLKNPRKFSELGARIPKGVLLVGPPGTGKTYLSKAVAGEAKVPFFSISGSDFVEMFVGVGASRVRDLFQEAKKNAPCIVFIDEIDAVGRRRGAGLGGGHDEREQTLNQLLVEMDGFSENEGIIVMSATNRPDILDPALLRPGRFDRTVYVGLPDVREREAILRVHTAKKKLEADVNLEDIAKTTAGFTPADLENLTNEAALLTARHGLDRITRGIFEEAAIKVVAGPEKKSKVVIEKERVLTAYHEAGHAIVSKLLPDTDPVHMITIIPRGMAGGFTAYLPAEERSYQTKKGMKFRLITLLGGRAAEALVLDDISTGASNDIERATELARDMVTAYGMSEHLGPMSYGKDSDDVFLGKDFGHVRNYSEAVATKIDQEMRSLIDEAYQAALRLLGDNVDFLHNVAKALLERETIKGDEFEEMYRQHVEQMEDSQPPEELIAVQDMEKKIDKVLSGETVDEIAEDEKDGQ